MENTLPTYDAVRSRLEAWLHDFKKHPDNDRVPNYHLVIALLGDWGVGKTYLWRKISKSCLANQQALQQTLCQRISQWRWGCAVVRGMWAVVHSLWKFLKFLFCLLKSLCHL